jgi:hypothetical protein
MSDDRALVMSFCQDAVPRGRRMFDVSAEETVQLANAYGLQAVLKLQAESVQRENRRIGVTWIHLAFINDDARK